jgi:hypothetical protein
MRIPEDSDLCKKKKWSFLCRYIDSTTPSPSVVFIGFSLKVLARLNLQAYTETF